jgi:hypothetical protein
VHLRTSLVQLFVLILQNFEKVVQMIELKRFGGAPHYNQLAPLSANLEGTNNIYKNGTMANIQSKATFTATVDIVLLTRMSPNSCVCWIHYYVLSYFCSRLVWHSVCFVKDLYEQIIFCLWM